MTSRTSGSRPSSGAMTAKPCSALNRPRHGRLGARRPSGRGPRRARARRDLDHPSMSSRAAEPTAPASVQRRRLGPAGLRRAARRANERVTVVAYRAASHVLGVLPLGVSWPLFRLGFLAGYALW